MTAAYYTHQGTELAGVILGLVFVALLVAWWKLGERAERRRQDRAFRSEIHRPYDQEID